MSNIIKAKLNEVYDEINGAISNIAESKIKIADALRFNGVNDVSDTETFERYAELITRLATANSMILEFQIPEESATTPYKRTIVLPMYFGVDGNEGYSLNAIAKEILKASPSTMAYTASQKQTSETSHIIDDVYGNKINDGNYTITLEDAERYLSPEQYMDFTSVAARLGVSLQAANDEEEFEPSVDATYSYTVDWGDGTPTCVFDEAKTYQENKSAIWHTYANAGTYDVSINGTYKRIYTDGDNHTSFIEDGKYITDTDGTIIIDNNNYGMRNYLIQIISWGNTLLTNMTEGFRACDSLVSIPMYDTTNSFADVTNFSYVFYRCKGLTSLPYNANTNTGLFSNCTAATTFAYAFAYCSNLSGELPPKLIDGCPNVRSVAGILGYCSKLKGSIPNGMFAGLTKLTNVTEAFASNIEMEGTIADDLFADSPNITSMDRLFYNCSKISGNISKNAFGNLSKLTSMRQAFYGCKNLTSIDSEAFYNIKSDNINFRRAFSNTGISEIPTGLLESLTGKNLMMEGMFESCASLTGISTTALASLKVANARGMFANCSSLTTALPNPNPDWDTYEGIKRWYGAFAKSSLSDIDSVCLELGGNGDRKFPEGKVGSIVLSGETFSFVDPKNYVYNEISKPIGIVYADVYIDEEASVPTIGNGEGNVVPDSGGAHKIYATVLNDRGQRWVTEQLYARDISAITNTLNVEVGYNKYTWNEDGENATLNTTRYNGEAYTKAINDYRVEQGMASYDEVSGYVATERDCFEAMNYVMTYSLNGEFSTQNCFLPDGADLWDQYVMKYLLQKAIDKIIDGGGGFSSSNAYSMREHTAYWASAEVSATEGWFCDTDDYLIGYWANKWTFMYVRPSFAITAV